MKIKFLSQALAHRHGVEVGEPVEVDDATAKEYLQGPAAIPAKESKVERAVKGPAETADTAAPTRSRKKR